MSSSGLVNQAPSAIMTADSTTCVKQAQEPCLDAETSAYLEAQTRAFVEAFANQDFDPESPAYADMIHKDYKHLGVTLPAGPSEALNFADFLAVQKSMLESSPELKFRLIDVWTTADSDGKVAQVMWNGEVTGCPPGVLRRMVTATGWKKTGGKWLCFWCKTLPGMAVGSEDDADGMW